MVKLAVLVLVETIPGLIYGLQIFLVWTQVGKCCWRNLFWRNALFGNLQGAPDSIGEAWWKCHKMSLNQTLSCDRFLKIKFDFGSIRANRHEWLMRPKHHAPGLHYVLVHVSIERTLLSCGMSLPSYLLISYGTCGDIVPWLNQSKNKKLCWSRMRLLFGI